jgi:CheY-like chemotaxis protein
VERPAKVVLVVDDDEFVRNGTEIVLEMLGYSVVTAENGKAALKVLEDGVAVDVMVADYAMPGMSGLALIERARLLIPDLPVLLITGYAVRVEGAKANAILRKPFQPQDLEGQVAAILRDRSTANTARSL